MESVALSLAIIIILGLVFAKGFEKIKIPGFFGMLILGILIGPYCFNLISSNLMNISPDIRILALIIILLRAGFGINKDSIHSVGLSVVKMSFIPSLLEGLTIMAMGHLLLGIPLLESVMLGFIVAAVSPAVIVPQMLSFIDKKIGTSKGIPNLILASAALDDVIVIAIFSAIMGIYGGSSINIAGDILSIPISIVLGAVIGFIVALITLTIFRKFNIHNTEKALLVLAFAIILKNIGDFSQSVIPLAGLVGVMVLSFVIMDRRSDLGVPLSHTFNKIWIFAEILVFVLVGAQVNLFLVWNYALVGILVLIIGLAARSAGVYISLMGTEFNLKEKLFCVVSFIPKATVQATIGAIPLAAGVASGELILAIAVLSILFTSPLGALAVRYVGRSAFEVEEVK
jgi:NhaP-type Na+/H+ or K+/H+ antiporter